MTPEAQRIALAELDGWTRNANEWRSPDLSRRRCLINDQPPNYLHDLNAMHELEKKLKPLHESFARHLSSILELNNEEELNTYDLWLISHATAAQRAEALLRTLDKWKEDE